MSLESQDNDAFDANLTRDLYAISSFGTLKGMLEDLDRLRQQQGSTLPHRRSTSERLSSVLSRGHRVVILPEDAMRPSVGRGAALDALRESIGSGYSDYFALTRELQEIGSGTLRNETIEAYFEDGYTKNKSEDCSVFDADEDVAKSLKTAAHTAIESDAMSTKQLPDPSSPASSMKLPYEQPLPAAQKPKNVKKLRNVVLKNCLANVNKELPQQCDKAKEVLTHPPVSSRTTFFTSVEDGDDSDALFDCKISFNLDNRTRSLSDSSEVEVESQESYLLDDEPLLDESQKNVGTQSDVSSSCLMFNNNESQSASSQKQSYLGTSCQNQIITKSPLVLQNPVFKRRLPPKAEECYIPHIVETSFTFRERDFPAL